jgi:RimJ/RimL family protein N-acetyltransferase
LSREDAKQPMIGDVNMFFHGDPSSTDEDEPFLAELEIMIAEAAYRRRGLATEALQMMISYAVGPEESALPWARSLPSYLTKPISPSSLVARVAINNASSIQLFEKLGFKIVKTIEVFGEVEMRWVNTLIM